MGRRTKALKEKSRAISGVVVEKPCLDKQNKRMKSLEERKKSRDGSKVKCIEPTKVSAMKLNVNGQTENERGSEKKFTSLDDGRKKRNGNSIDKMMDTNATRHNTVHHSEEESPETTTMAEVVGKPPKKKKKKKKKKKGSGHDVESQPRSNDDEIEVTEEVERLDDGRAIDDIFSSLKARKYSNTKNKSTKRKASDDSYAMAEKRPRKTQTQDGYRVYQIDTLNMGKGGGTPDCPFDCSCCF